MRIPALPLLLFLSLQLPLAINASEVQFAADSAVAEILFEFDGSEMYASYAVGEDGFVDITFARNIPDDLYIEILHRLKDDERISGVLAGTSGPSCRLF